jgi:polyisoprenyl-phosphate glycosyltransferase
VTLVSVVVPVYQNGPNLPTTYLALVSVLNEHRGAFNYELVFVNDGSTDDSWEQLTRICALDPTRVTLVNLTRNFGQVSALLAGIQQAAGDCVVSISADLQDPPSLIPSMVAAWREGHKLVLAARDSREDDIVARTTSKVFYGLIRSLSLPRMPAGGFDFFLLDRQLANIVTQTSESNPFIQGLVLWPGFVPKVLTYRRRKRTIGKSQWRTFRKIKYFIDGLLAYSYVPIRLMSVLGLAFCCIGVLLACAIVVQRVLFGTELQGWSSLVMAVLTIGGIQILMLGILGEYVWRTFDQVKARPLFLVEKVIAAPGPLNIEEAHEELPVRENGTGQQQLRI